MPEPASFVNPLSPLGHFDVFFVDQQSVCVPFLRFFLGTRVVFYCHFPDKLLSGGWEVEADTQGEGNVKVGVKGRGLARRFYRWPVDKLEEFTTGQLDHPTSLVLETDHQGNSFQLELHLPSLCPLVPIFGEAETKSRLPMYRRVSV
jgi:hypothetical protein